MDRSFESQQSLDSGKEMQPQLHEDVESKPEKNSFSIRKRFTEIFSKSVRADSVELPHTPSVSKKEIVLAVSGSLLGAAGSILGLKGFVDVPRWFAQKYAASRARKRITAEYDAKSAESVLAGDVSEESEPSIVEESSSIKIDEGYKEEVRTQDMQREASREGVDVAVMQKLQSVEASIDASTRLSDTEKIEMKKQARGIVLGYEEKIIKANKTREEAITRLVDETVHTKVTTATALKEGVNSALMLSGLLLVRTAFYSATSLIERYKKVKREMAEGKREENLGKEYLVNGFKEVWNGIRFKGGESKREKVVNFAKALGVLSRFIGLANLTVHEFTNDHVGESFNKILDAWEGKSLDTFAKDNLLESIHLATFGGVEAPHPPEGGMLAPLASRFSSSDFDTHGIDVSHVAGHTTHTLHSVDVSHIAGHAPIAEAVEGTERVTEQGSEVGHAVAHKHPKKIKPQA